MMFMSAGASAIDLLATKPNPSDWKAGLWNSRGAWKPWPWPGCAAQNGSAASSSSARRARDTGNAMAERRPEPLPGGVSTPPRANPTRSQSVARTTSCPSRADETRTGRRKASEEGRGLGAGQRWAGVCLPAAKTGSFLLPWFLPRVSAV